MTYESAALFLLVIAGLFHTYKIGYRQGFKDCRNGKVRSL